MSEELNFEQEQTPQVEYTEANIRHMDDMEHIRTRPGMYIGKLGDGSQADDGIYVLLKEIVDNSIDEFRMHVGRRVEIDLIENKSVRVRDYGRGIPLGSLLAASSVLNTGGKFDSKAFKKSVGLNGVGLKAVNALSREFSVSSIRDGQMRSLKFRKGKLISDVTTDTQDEHGTEVCFTPDEKLFVNYSFTPAIIETMMRNYSYLNTGLAFIYNGQRFFSRSGLEDLLTERISSNILYPIVHLQADDIEIAFTHTDQYGEEYYSFVNGQYTSQGGTHQSAFKEHIARTIKEFFGKNQEAVDIRNGMVAAVAINVEEPMFESQTKIKLGSQTMTPNGTLTVNRFIGDFIKKEVDDFLHMTPAVSDVMLQKIQDSEKERKAIAGVTKAAREKAKKANFHNRKLSDCKFHFNDVKGDRIEESSIFITEGDSASGSIIKTRDVNTQAVFSLRGKPLNTFGLTKEVIYKNEEFMLLQAALNIEDGLDGLRYNKVIVATDADDDGMHIRALLITFFLQYFPDLIKKGHVFILQTPLFRVRNKRKKVSKQKQEVTTSGIVTENGEFETIYCYNEQEREQAVEKLGPNPEITRFKGLGEISPDEFRHFIDANIRLEQVTLQKTDSVLNLLSFYMGKNTMERQQFIINNLIIEQDQVEETEQLFD